MKGDAKVAKRDNFNVEEFNAQVCNKPAQALDVMPGIARACLQRLPEPTQISPNYRWRVWSITARQI